MKKTIKVFGIIAVIAIIGFSMAACDLNLPEDGLTVTGIPKDYNGKWAFFYSANKGLYGAESIASGTYTLVKISGESVNLPIWEDATGEVRYNDSDQITDGIIRIFNSKKTITTGDSRDYEITLPAFSFTDGYAEVIWPSSN